MYSEEKGTLKVYLMLFYLEDHPLHIIIKADYEHEAADYIKTCFMHAKDIKTLESRVYYWNDKIEIGFK